MLMQILLSKIILIILILMHFRVRNETKLKKLKTHTLGPHLKFFKNVFLSIRVQANTDSNY